MTKGIRPLHGQPRRHADPKQTEKIGEKQIAAGQFCLWAWAAARRRRDPTLDCFSHRPTSRQADGSDSELPMADYEERLLGLRGAMARAKPLRRTNGGTCTGSAGNGSEARPDRIAESEVRLRTSGPRVRVIMIAQNRADSESVIPDQLLRIDCESSSRVVTLMICPHAQPLAALLLFFLCARASTQNGAYGSKFGLGFVGPPIRENACQIFLFASRQVPARGMSLRKVSHKAFIFSVFSRNQEKTKAQTWRSVSSEALQSL